MIDSAELWERFYSALSEHLQAASNVELAAAWATHADRTLFYRKNILQKVADSLEYEFDTELFKVDFAMWTKTDPKVPIIFVESENQASTAHHEVRKLMCISAPLRVLIVTVQWDETPGAWRAGGMRKQLLKEWQKIIIGYGDVWPRSGLFGLVVGEWRTDSALRFYANAIDGKGELVWTEDKMFEKQMGVPLEIAPIKTCDPEPTTQSQPKSLREALPRRTILVAVENDAPLLKETSELCAEEGHDVFQAQSNTEAIARMRQSEIHALVYRLRGDDREVIQCCRSQCPSASIVLLVDCSEAEQAVEAMKMGACDYLQMPVQREEFQRLIAFAIDEHRSRAHFFGKRAQ